MATDITPKFKTNAEGYLENFSDWRRQFAIDNATAAGVDLTDDHWQVIDFLRDYYEEYQISPAVRILAKATGRMLGHEKGTTKYLFELFPYGPATQACKWAGLPRPTGCV